MTFCNLQAQYRKRDSSYFKMIFFEVMSTIPASYRQHVAKGGTELFFGTKTLKSGANFGFFLKNLSKEPNVCIGTLLLLTLCKKKIKIIVKY